MEWCVCGVMTKEHESAEEKSKTQVCAWGEACNILHNGPAADAPIHQAGKEHN